MTFVTLLTALGSGQALAISAASHIQASTCTTRGERIEQETPGLQCQRFPYLKGVVWGTALQEILPLDLDLLDEHRDKVPHTHTLVLYKPGAHQPIKMASSSA